jgi:putative YpdA family bacillithiol system oxidoreductase
MSEFYDLIIIGAGPAGISAADAAKREGLNYLVIEKGLIANTVYNYPIGLTVFSTTNELELNHNSLRPAREKPTREELLSYYVRFALDNELNINTEEEVLSVEKINDEFVIETSKSEYKAARVLFAIGAMDYPRRLNCKGEDLPKVFHRFRETYPFVRKDALVVGGGNSAAEAALFLSQEGARTTLAIWRSDWENRDPKQGAIKHWVRTPLEKQIELGHLRVLLFKNVLEIKNDKVKLIDDNGVVHLLPNDVVFILIGSDADLTLLKNLGVQTEQSKYGEVPFYDKETFETNVRGVYVAGHFTLNRHIKEAIEVPRKIIPMIASSLKSNRESDERRFRA